MALIGARSLLRAQPELRLRVLTTWASSTWSTIDTAVTSQQSGLPPNAVQGQGNADHECGISTLPSGISRVAALPQAAQLALNSRSQQASVHTVAAVTSSEDEETKPRQAPAGKGARPGEASQTATAAAMSDPKRIKRVTKATRAPAQADATPADPGSRDQTAAVQVKEKPKVQTRRPKKVKEGAKAATAEGVSQKGWRLAAWMAFLNAELAKFRGQGVNLNDKKKEVGQQWKALAEEKKRKFAP